MHKSKCKPSNIGVQLLAIEAAVTKDRKKIYQAAMMGAAYAIGAQYTGYHPYV